MASKKATYSPVGDDLSFAIALTQAANALDIAAEHAIASRDSTALTEAAHGWLRMAQALQVEMHADDEHEEPNSDKSPRLVGFTRKET